MDKQSFDEVLDEIILQYHAELKQGLNELAGNGTADEQVKQAIKQAIATYIIGEDRLPTYRNGVIVGESSPFSSNMSDSPVFGAGYNTAKGEMRKLLYPEQEGGEIKKHKSVDIYLSRML